MLNVAGKAAPKNAFSDLWPFVPLDGTSHFAQVQPTQVRRAEGAQVEVAIVLVGLANVCGHCAVWVMEAPHTCSSILQLHHQTVPRHKLHHHVLAEELKENGQAPKIRKENHQCLLHHSNKARAPYRSVL